VDAEPISALAKDLSAYYLASADDAHAARFFAETSPARMREGIAAPQETWLVAEIDGRFAGFVSTRGSHVRHFFVERRFQDRHVGRRLWEHALAALCADGARPDITVDASVFAVPVYGRFGFEIAGERSTELGVTFVPMILRGADLPG
jgi:GNAT superfamily N-acetyltransferase